MNDEELTECVRGRIWRETVFEENLPVSGLGRGNINSEFPISSNFSVSKPTF